MKRVLKVTLALAAAWLLSGCSAVRFAYENADAYLRWRANSYVDLSGAAYDELDDRIDDFFGWHRAHALPQYARLFEEAASKVGKGLSRGDLVWGYDSVMGQARESLRAAAERMAPLLDDLSAQHIERMQERFEEDNRKFRRDNLRGSEKERRERRAKRTQERLEDWVGALDRAQVQRVRQFSERAPLYDELRDRERRRIQAELVAIASARQAGALLAERAANFERGRDPALAAASAATRHEFFELLLALDGMLSAGQRAQAVANLRRYAGDFIVLARPGGEQRTQ